MIEECGICGREMQNVAFNAIYIKIQMGGLTFTWTTCIECYPKATVIFTDVLKNIREV